MDRLRYWLVRQPSTTLVTSIEQLNGSDQHSDVHLLSGEDYVYNYINQIKALIENIQGEINDKVFHDVLFSTFQSRFKDHQHVVIGLRAIKARLEQQCNDIDADIYLDLDEITLETYVKTKHSFAKFLQSDDHIDTMKSAVYFIQSNVDELSVLYARLKDHPSFPSFKKEYIHRMIRPFMLELFQYTTQLIEHGINNEFDEQ